MIDTLFSYRTHSVQDCLVTPPQLAEKIGPAGEILRFPGNTVVFLLEEPVKTRLTALQRGLYQALNRNGRPMLAQPLHPSTFHMTLHDLANPALGADWEQRKRAMAAEAEALLQELWRDELPGLNLQATCTFQMVSTSIVLGLEPADGASWALLDELYGRFQRVRPLSYALTPHITLAYFIPGRYEGRSADALRAALGPVPDFALRLDTKRLVLQDFESMNCYRTVRTPQLQSGRKEEHLLQDKNSGLL